jgi:hypothetical protein
MVHLLGYWLENALVALEGAGEGRQWFFFLLFSGVFLPRFYKLLVDAWLYPRYFLVFCAAAAGGCVMSTV